MFSQSSRVSRHKKRIICQCSKRKTYAKVDLKQKKTTGYPISCIAVKIISSSLYVNCRLSGSRRTVFLLFLLPAGLVFDRAVAAFVVFDFHSHEKKS